MGKTKWLIWLERQTYSFSSKLCMMLSTSIYSQHLVILFKMLKMYIINCWALLYKMCLGIYGFGCILCPICFYVYKWKTNDLKVAVLEFGDITIEAFLCFWVASLWSELFCKPHKSICILWSSNTTLISIR